MIAAMVCVVGLIAGAGALTASAQPEVLYDSLYIFDDGLVDGAVGNAIGGATAFPALGTIDSQVCDDIEIVGGSYRLTRMVRDYQSYFGTEPAEGIRVQIYPDAGGFPDEDVYADYIVPVGSFTSIDLGILIGFQVWRFDMDLSGVNIVLGPGVWWVDVQPLDEFTTGDWFWSVRSIITLVTGPIHVRDGATHHGNSYYGLWNSPVWIPLNFRGNGTLSMRIEGEAEGGGLRLALEGECPGRITARAGGASPGNRVYFVYGLRDGFTAIPGCGGVGVDIANPALAGTDVADGNGEASVAGNVPGAGCGVVRVQAVERATCAVSNKEIIQ